MIGGTKDWEWDVHSVLIVENQKAQEVRFTGKQDFERLHFELKIKKKKYNETCSYGSSRSMH